MAEPVTFQIGQRLWFVAYERRRSEPYEVEITKIGRQYATVKAGVRWEMRFRMDEGSPAGLAWTVDGGNFSSPGKVWISREAWEDHTALQSVWSAFRRGVDRMHGPPPGVQIGTIHRVARILGLTAKREGE